MDKIKIGYSTFDIRKVKPHSTLIVGDEIFGEINYNDLCIYINNTCNENEQKITLIHEVLHGISDTFDIGLSEEQVEKLGKGLFTVLTDNGLNVVKYEIEDRL